jgi:hypothetical protein
MWTRGQVLGLLSSKERGHRVKHRNSRFSVRQSMLLGVHNLDDDRRQRCGIAGRLTEPHGCVVDLHPGGVAVPIRGLKERLWLGIKRLTVRPWSR